MKPFKTQAAILLLCYGVLISVAFQIATMARNASAGGSGLVLVVAPPWQGGASEVVRAAGGRVIGPTRAPLSVLSDGATPEALRAAGAWAVLDPASLQFLCRAENLT